MINTKTDIHDDCLNSKEIKNLEQSEPEIAERLKKYCILSNEKYLQLLKKTKAIESILRKW